MCRNIKTLFNFEPPVTEQEIQAASLQFVRKISGFNKPSKVNEAAFFAAIADVTAISGRLLSALATNAPPKNRGMELTKMQERRHRAGRSGNRSSDRSPSLIPQPGP
jgi:hypothetical protein